jgi:hypothetical protein
VFQTTLRNVKMSAFAPIAEGMTVKTPDHHSKYLAEAVAALTPDGRQRIDELLAQLAVAGSREVVDLRTVQDRRVGLQT